TPERLAARPILPESNAPTFIRNRFQSALLRGRVHRPHPSTIPRQSMPMRCGGHHVTPSAAFHCQETKRLPWPEIPTTAKPISKFTLLVICPSLAPDKLWLSTQLPLRFISPAASTSVGMAS